MFCGELLMAFFAVWTVHHDTHNHPEIARTQRGFWKNKLTFSMFYHMEHHLFPAVPTIKLPELAKRIDEVLPELKKNKLFNAIKSPEGTLYNRIGCQSYHTNYNQIKKCQQFI